MNVLFYEYILRMAISCYSLYLECTDNILYRLITVSVKIVQYAKKPLASKLRNLCIYLFLVLSIALAVLICIKHKKRSYHHLFLLPLSL